MEIGYVRIVLVENLKRQQNMSEVVEGDKCDNCNSPIVFVSTQETSIHYGKLVCSKCNKWFKFVTKPNPDGERKGTSRYELEQVMKFYKLEEPFCFFCLRKKEQLGFNETLTRDHIKELDKDGEDILENLQLLCSACHKLKNWMRLYLNWHLNKK